MGSIDTRLERGVGLFRRAGDDTALLGAALLAFHGALERYLDEQIVALPDLSAQERELVERGRLSWLVRADRAQSAGLLTAAQRDRTLRATHARVSIARGDGFTWGVAEVQEYGRMVANICGRMELIGRIDQRAERAKATMANQAPPPVWIAPQERWHFSWLRLFGSIVFLAALVGVGWILFTQIGGTQFLRGVGALPAPTAAPTIAAPTPTATPTPPSARIVGLGTATGWLHMSASFDSPTRPIPLAEGMTVTPLGDQQVDSGGVVWRLVQVRGYQGWVPDSNLATDGR